MKMGMLVLVAFLVTGCSNTTTVDVPAGPWGSELGVLTVTDTSTVFIRECGSGVLDERLESDEKGRFESTGTYYVAQGGPCCGYSGIYAGRIDGDVMTLTIRNAQDGDVLFGPLILTRGTTHTFDNLCPVLTGQ
jgi:hypothetical protein